MIHRLLCLSLLLLSHFVLVAQDTVVVQTLTWEDDTRSGMFQFPDDPGETYEKIIMRYNMRCHDAAVGSGNIGCREWDYSCNTFITDPERIDSIQRMHPSMIITGFDGESFEYSNGPYYNFIEYGQFETTIGNPIPGWIQVGDENVPMSLGSIHPRSRQQYIYKFSELLSAGLVAGPIQAIQLYVQESAVDQMPFLRIRINSVLRDSLNEGNQDINYFQEVYFTNTDFSATGWKTLPFYQPFEWDGMSDILVDISFQGHEPTPIVEFAGHQTAEVHTGASPDPADSYYVGLHGDGWAEVPSQALGMDQEVTVAFWSYGLPDALTSNTTIFEAMDDASRRQMNVHLPWSDGNVYWDCGNDGTGYDRISKQADAKVLAGQWSHWAFTKNTTSGVMSIYLNGSLWHVGFSHKRPISATRMFVGSGDNRRWLYPGKLDNFSMWRKALSIPEIQQIMFTDDFSDHPAKDDLIVHYPFNEGNGLVAQDASGNGFDAALFGPNWQTFRGLDLFQNWATIPYRVNVRFGQGGGENEVVTKNVIDSVLVSPSTIIEYDVDPSNSLVVDTVYELYPGGFSFLYDVNGNVLNIFDAPVDGTLDIGNLTYFDKKPAKFELLSLVTPYGNGLDLGPGGKTFYFDVTDFAPVLRGERFLSMEMGGQNQEEIDIQFWFVKGTPAREVFNIENIWPFGRGNIGDILQDLVFENRPISLIPDAHAYKLKASVTGHGQNGEFVPRQHFLDINGGSQEFIFDVWKECADNPIYPQGGTWLFDRAGWCPGAATDVHEFYLPEETGTQITLDYGVNGALMTEANYLVSTQLVTYGPPNFTLDAAIETIIRPSTRVEFERFNPACSEPLIVVKNNGTETITSLEISYGVEGGASESYIWSGSLEFLETVFIPLPVTDYKFWETANTIPTFFAQLLDVNNLSDEYLNNNTMRSEFSAASIFDHENLVLSLKTNKRPEENRYTIRDATGNVVMSRDNMDANTTYNDDIMLPPGCYTFKFEDDGDDGLYYWYWPLIGVDAGTGDLSFRRRFNETLLLPIYSFESEHGSGVQLDFVIPETVSTTLLDHPNRVSVYPNPASDLVTLELNGFKNHLGLLQVSDLRGKLLQEREFIISGGDHAEDVELRDLVPGMYFLRVVTNDRVYTREVILTGK